MFIVSLPIQDRARSHRFYRGLGLTPVGPLAEDGLPEPLQFDLAEGARLMLVPQDGFRWVLGGRPLAPSGSTECLLNLSTASPEALDDLIRRAAEAGADLIVEPAHQPWGYAAVFTDPDGHAWMVTTAP
ncbi:VOC family protein [Allokutzneria sp. NRRL B-24872]|uniref:VOC family protein n=1 Tax=Allokutzneria sp. NRRL B-24872 TaxID=1137961 RepID=UPI001FEDC6DB|nr:VOC family protein [Allokutzneria sp. NRRL B-24872]